MWVAVEHANRLSEFTEFLQKGYDAESPSRVQGTRIDIVEHSLPVVKAGRPDRPVSLGEFANEFVRQNPFRTLDQLALLLDVRGLSAIGAYRWVLSKKETLDALYSHF
jgi:hypothetical protein